MTTPTFSWDSSVNKSILAFYNSVTGLPVFMDETTGLPVDVTDRDARVLGRVKISDGTDVLDVLVQDAAFGTASKGLGVFGKYQVTPTAYTDGDAAPILLDANGRVVLSSDIQIGAVELKDADTDGRANIKAANTARTTATLVIATQPIDGAGAVLSTSALATAAKQDTLLTELQLKADLTETQPISAASLPLPTGAATETTLAALNTKVTACNTGAVVVASGAITETNSAGIKTGTDKIPAQGQALMASSTPVAIASNQSAVPVSGTVTANLGTIADVATQTTLALIKAKTDNIDVAASTLAKEATQLLQPLAATTPTLYNVTMTLANTEYSQALPANTKKIKFRCQDVGFDVRTAYETGKVATPTAPWSLLAAGEVETEDDLNLTSKTLYFACGTAAKVMEITCWT